MRLEEHEYWLTDLVHRLLIPAATMKNPGSEIVAMNSIALSATLVAALGAAAASNESAKPNIVVIVTDDQGYADISFNPHHPKEVSTPHMDVLAREGVFFSQAYVSGNVCSPTRAGLMLGRYQHRVGVYTAGDGGRGFDPAIPIFPAMLPDAYVSMAIGKWHLGLDEDTPELRWHAVNRGFDDFYGFMGRGAHDYFQLTRDYGLPLYRGKQHVDDKGYLTTRLTEEAVEFIERSKGRPFFLYLAYNAVHAPPQAPEEDVERFKRQFPELSDTRATLMAMLYHLDLGVGNVVQKLKETGAWQNTLMFFLTDNGGSKAMEANNGILRGFKGSNYEGGIRTPLVVSWPERFEGGRTIDTPVISLDILPTALGAIGTEPPAAVEFDGKSLLPLLMGKTTSHHQTLYWSSSPNGSDWAVRHGDWKLHALRDQRELLNLATDPSEADNLAKQHPEKVEELNALYDVWIAQMADPVDRSGTGSGKEAEKDTAREQKRKTKRAERQRQREQEKDEK